MDMSPKEGYEVWCKWDIRRVCNVDRDGQWKHWMGDGMYKGQEELQWSVAADTPVIKSWIHCVFLVIVL